MMYPPIGEDFVFRTEAGRPMDPDTWHKERLVPILKTANLRLPGAGLHSLRHTYVSLLIAQGEDPRYIADQVGHANVKLTTDLYAHVFTRVRVDAMRRLGDAIRSSNHPAEQAGTASTTANSREDG
jgi:integrase